MKCLLDTHTYFWWKCNQDRLSTRVRELLSAPENVLLVSIVTPWELAIKTKGGKLDALKLLKNFEERESEAGFVLLGATAAQAIRSGLFPLHHKDPFDRLLAAQALDLDIPLLSQDNVFELYGVKRIWD
jgi:PIN domain nuclease of toxin-antitoxin system